MILLHPLFFLKMSFQIALNKNGSFGYAMLVKIIYIFLIRPLIIINANILIKRAKNSWGGLGEGGGRKPALSAS